MPLKPGRPCRYSRCPHLALDKSGYCEQHKKQEQQLQDQARGSSSERGYDARWQKIRLVFLNSHPLCQDCYDMNPRQVTPATEVHHLKALRDGGSNDEGNLRALCKACHSKRTAKEQGFASGG